MRQRNGVFAVGVPVSVSASEYAGLMISIYLGETVLDVHMNKTLHVRVPLFAIVLHVTGADEH